MNDKTKVFDFCIDEVKWVNNKVMNRYLIKHNGITSIVPVIDKKNILLVRQYRYGADQIIWEVPAGTIDQNETPLKCAKRELKEETGYILQITDLVFSKFLKQIELFYHLMILNPL